VRFCTTIPIHVPEEAKQIQVAIGAPLILHLAVYDDSVCCRRCPAEKPYVCRSERGIARDLGVSRDVISSRSIICYDLLQPIDQSEILINWANRTAVPNHPPMSPLVNGSVATGQRPAALPQQHCAFLLIHLVML